MRVNGNNIGGVFAGTYPAYMNFKSLPCAGADEFEDSNPVNALMIPTNYVDSAVQTASDDAYSAVQAAFGYDFPMVGDAQTLRFKAQNVANYRSLASMSVAPFSEYKFIHDGLRDSTSNMLYAKTDTNKIMQMWLEEDPTDVTRSLFKFRVGDFSALPIAWTDVQTVTGKYQNSPSDEYWALEQLDTDKMIVIYSDDSGSNDVSAFAFSLDANDEFSSAGTTLQLEAAVRYNIMVERVATDKVIWGYNASHCMIISCSTLTLSKGSYTDCSGTGSTTSTSFQFVYMDTDKVLFHMQDNATPWGGHVRILTVSTTTITPQTENVGSYGSGTAGYVLGTYKLSSTLAVAWWYYSSAYYLDFINISGNTATWQAFKAKSIASTDRFIGCADAGACWFFDYTGTAGEYDVYKYSTSFAPDGSVRAQFSTSLQTPQSTASNIPYMNKDVGLPFGFGRISDTDTDATFLLVGGDIDPDVVINGNTVRANTGTDSFTIDIADYVEVNSETLEIELVNQSGAGRIMSIPTLNASVI